MILPPVSEDNFRVSDILPKKDIELLPRAIDESVLNLSQGGKAHRLVRELSDFTMSKNKDMTGHELSFTLPRQALRALDPSSLATGGALVGVDVGEAQLAPRPASVVELAGGNVVEGLTSNFSLPRELAGSEFSTASFLHQQDPVTTAAAGTASLGQTGASPKRAAFTYNVDKQLLRQAPQFSGFATAAANATMDFLADKGFLSGAGGVEPLGIINNPNVLTETWGATMSLAKLVDYQTLILNNNGRVSRISYVGHPGVRAKAQTVQEFSGSSFGLWHWNETLGGRPALTTTNVGAANLIAGDFSTAYICFFGAGAPVEFVLDQYTSKKSGLVEVLVTFYMDAFVSQPGLWVRNTDSSLQ